MKRKIFILLLIYSVLISMSCKKNYIDKTKIIYENRVINYGEIFQQNKILFSNNINDEIINIFVRDGTIIIYW